MRARGTPLFCAADVPEKLWKLPIKINERAENKRTDVASLLPLSDILYRSATRKTIGCYVCARLAVFQGAHIETYIALSVQGSLSVKLEGTFKSPLIGLYAGGARRGGGVS